MKSWTKRSLVRAWAAKSASKVSKAAGAIGALLPHQTASSVRPSRTTNLSFGERPVCWPVLATRAPWALSEASARSSAS